jgi:uncharacterized protein (TIGR03032 family)
MPTEPKEQDAAEAAPAAPPADENANQGEEVKKEGEPPSNEIKPLQYHYTTNLPALFAQLDISILASSYRTHRLMTFSAGGSVLNGMVRIFETPAGFTFKGRSMALATERSIWFFEAPTDLKRPDGTPIPYDYFLVPRRSHITGGIAAHDIHYVGDELYYINTAFSCICTLDPAWNFVPRWKPKYITALASEDRCHLNGFCVDETGPRYVTAFSATNEAGGWRPVKKTAGILMDYRSKEIICEGLCMPHTPRLYNGELYILDSGQGDFQKVDVASGQRETIARLPGYVRGLAFHGKYAFIGCGLIRPKNIEDAAPVFQRESQLRCAIFVVDMETGQSVGHIEFMSGIQEFYEIAVLPGIRNPYIVGFKEPEIDGIFVFPPLQEKK